MKKINLDFDGYWREINKNSIPSKSGVYCVYSCVYNSSNKTVKNYYILVNPKMFTIELPIMIGLRIGKKNYRTMKPYVIRLDRLVRETEFEQKLQWYSNTSRQWMRSILIISRMKIQKWSWPGRQTFWIQILLLRRAYKEKLSFLSLTT